jgi:Ca-activated chloride channel homolog
VVALVVVTAGSYFAVQKLSAATCSGQAPLTVAAAPEIADAVKDAVAQLVTDGAEINGACVAIEVTSADPADVAAAIAAPHGVTLNGVGLPSGNIMIPDVWIPDSVTWLARVGSNVPDFKPGESQSIARSPVVVAMPEPIAASLGWPNAKLTWPMLLSRMTTGTPLKIGIVEPARDAAGLSGLLALGAAAGAAPNAQAATTGALRTLAAGRSSLRQEMLARFPRAADAAALASGLGAAPLSEQAVINYNAAKPPVSLAALYLEPAPLSLNYPFTVLPTSSAERAPVAELLRQTLATPAFMDRLAKIGLRSPDGTAGNGFAAPTGAPETAGSPMPTSTAPAAGADPATVERALSTWTAVTLPARMLAIIDVSGSMLQTVPTAGGATREQVTLEAARRGLGLFDDSWAVGLWTFSTELDGAKDYKQLMPIGPLSTQRSQMLAALGAIQPKPTGDTGLYDTILASYQYVQQGWDPGRVNSVVMLTDGDNDDKNGISHADLLAKLKEVADPNRPIQVVIIGIGSVNPAPLEEITKQTGGGVFVTEDPAKIGDIFLKAISLRSVAPK